MQYTDSISKNFLTGSGTFFNTLGAGASDEALLARGSSRNEILGVTRWNSIEDFTYMGFYFRFLPNTTTSDNVDLDYLPQGLFLGASSTKAGNEQAAGSGTASTESIEHPDSAVSFLRRRGEYYRADMMTEFRQGMIYLAQETPWVFQKVSGLADIWKIDPKINWRGKDKKIVFECDESINLRVTYLADLYRKAAFDAEYMRYMLPDTQRYFSMELIVTEIRTLRNPDSRATVLEPATFIRFIFDYCEFDFFDDAPSYLDSPAVYVQEKAGFKIPIKIGRIRERNSYGLLGALLSDTFGVYLRGKENGQKSFTSSTTVKDATGENVNAQSSVSAGIKRTSYDNRRTSSENRFSNQPGNAYGNPPRADLGLLSQVATGALASLQSLSQNLVNRAILGNVYGFSLGTLAGRLSGILNNPIAAVQGIASSFTSNQQQAASIAGNVQLTGPDMQLINDFVGAVDYVKQVAPGVNLEEITLGDLIRGAVPSQNLQGSPASAFLQAPESSTQNLGKESLTIPPANANPPGKEELRAPNIMNTTLGKILFGGATTSEGSIDKVILSGPVSNLAGNPGHAELSILPKNLGNPGSTDLIAPNTREAGSSQVELESPGSSLEGSATKVELESSGSSLEGRTEKVTLESPALSANSPATVDLSSPPKSSLEGSPQVRLQGPPIPPSERPDGVNLISPLNRNNELGKIELE